MTRNEKKLLEATLKWYHYYSEVVLAKAQRGLNFWYPKMCAAAREVIAERKKAK